MTILLAAVLLCTGAFAAEPAPAPKGAPAVAASTAAAVSSSSALGVSTYTVSTLYTGDKVRDPFMPASVGGGSGRVHDKNTAFAVDIHALELRGIMRDAQSDFALFSTDTGATLILRGRRLYDERNKPIPGVTGSINIKQKRAELITADKDRQPFQLGEPDAGRAKDKPGAE